MKLRKTAAVYAIAVGIGMIALWLMLLSTGQVPELAAAPAEIVLHIAAEGIIALVLLAGGIVLLRRAGWGYRVYVLAMGGLLYSIVNSSGYYVQRGNMAMTAMFAVLLVLTVFFTVLALSRRSEAA